MPLLSYGRALSVKAEREPTAIAVTHEGVSTTFRALEAGANRRARAFAERGVAEGDFVTLALPNGLEFIESFFACWKLGATPQPISARLPYAERDAIVELVDPKLIVGVEPGEHGERPTLASGLDVSHLDGGPLPDRTARFRMAICSGDSSPVT